MSSRQHHPSEEKKAHWPDTRPRVTKPEEATLLVEAALLALDRLEPLIDEETRGLQRGKVREALGLAVEKNEAAQIYTRCLEAMKHNAIAIGRFQPSGLDRLLARHQSFVDKMALNMAVVATARTVFEGLLRDLADSLGRNASPVTYAPAGIKRKAGTAPLALSRLS